MDRCQYVMDFNGGKTLGSSSTPSECTDVGGDEDVRQRFVGEKMRQDGSDLESIMVELCPPSKELSARRRAFRRAALNKARAKKEECSGSVVHGGMSNHGSVGECAKFDLGNVKAEGCSSNGSGRINNAEPVDKKAARAIRNREAAMKSRIEAKLKMRKLQDENKCLAMKVENLSRENESLTVQLRNVLQHTLGMGVEGQDVKQLLSILSQVSANGCQC